jgi:mitogen-activated protein kinase kinase 1 interacting protein 1
LEQHPQPHAGDASSTSSPQPLPTTTAKSASSQQSENASLIATFDKLMTVQPELLGVIVTDKDGVILVKFIAPAAAGVVNADFSVMTTAALATQQASKVNLGECKTAATFYGEHQLVYASHAPLIVTLVADADANTEQLTALVPLLCARLEGLRISLLAEQQD